MEHGLVHVLAQLHQDEPVAEPQLFHHYTKCKKKLKVLPNQLFKYMMNKNTL
jgi:hypothetical protein